MKQIFEVTLLIFIVLKLGGLVAWPWWVVLAPLWIPFAIFVPILLLARPS